MTRPPWWAFACLAGSMALVGVYVALSKPLVAALPVFLLAWLRFGIGGLAMWHWLKRPADEPAMAPGTRWLVFFESLFGNFLFSICMLYGMSLTSAVSAGVVMASIPAACALLGWVVLHEKPSGRVLIAIALAVAGIALVSLTKAEGAESRNALLGNLLLLGAVGCEAVYAVVGKKLTGALSPKRIAALVNAWGFVLMTPMGLWLALGFDFGAVQPAVWGLLVFYALAASVWSVWLWMTGLKYVSASRAGVYAALLPLSTAAVGVVFLGEKITGLQVIAYAVALAGVVLATLPDKDVATPAETAPRP
jgi:drug/metabolite transporter (DMT)-like permease